MKKYLIILLLIPNICFASIESDINTYRKSIGLKKLEISKTLQQTANFKVNDEIFWKYYGHINPNGARLRDIFTRFNIPCTHKLSGEILAKNYTIKEVVKAWLKSSIHKSVITEKKFTKIGCAKQLNYIACHFMN